MIAATYIAVGYHIFDILDLIAPAYLVQRCCHFSVVDHQYEELMFVRSSYFDE